MDIDPELLRARGLSAAPRQVGNVIGTTDAGTYDLYGRRIYVSATIDL